MDNLSYRNVENLFIIDPTPREDNVDKWFGLNRGKKLQKDGYLYSLTSAGIFVIFRGTGPQRGCRDIRQLSSDV